MSNIQTLLKIIFEASNSDLLISEFRKNKDLYKKLPQIQQIGVLLLLIEMIMQLEI